MYPYTKKAAGPLRPSHAVLVVGPREGLRKLRSPLQDAAHPTSSLNFTRPLSQHPPTFPNLTRPLAPTYAVTILTNTHNIFIFVHI